MEEYAKVEVEKIVEDVLPEEGKEIMTSVTESLVNEGIEIGTVKGIEIGREEGRFGLAVDMAQRGVSLEIVSQVSGFSIQNLMKALQKQLS